VRTHLRVATLNAALTAQRAGKVENLKRRCDNPAMILPGDQFDAGFEADDGAITLRRIKRRTKWVDIWKQCPVPMDDLPPRSREMPKKIRAYFKIRV
jgi:hypothetical protein